jgi:hypothetical protein
MNQMGYIQFINLNSMFLTRIFGHSESLCSFDTLQFEDCSKYVAPRFNPEHKAKRRKEVFPQDCNKAFEMGQRLTKK